MTPSKALKSIHTAEERTKQLGTDILCMDGCLPVSETMDDMLELVSKLRDYGYKRFILTDSSTSFRHVLNQLLMAGCKVGMPIEITKQNTFNPKPELATVIEL